MLTLRRLALYSFILVTLAGTLAACGKKDANVETDYNSKKASAETLINQINTSMASMTKDHSTWMAALDQASKKPGADTAKINSLRQDMQKHDADGKQIMALIDSVKMYMNVTPDAGDDQFKNADDRLSANFNDLNDKWKSYQDKHTSLAQDVQQFAVTTAGNAVTDTAKANTASTTSKTETKTETKSTTPAPGAHETVKHHEGGVPKTTSQGTTPTPSTPTQSGNAHQTAKHHEGGVPKTTGQ